MSDATKTKVQLIEESNELCQWMESMESAEAGHGEETILLIDGNESVYQSIGSALRHKGYNVLVATNGQEGLDLFEREVDRVDLILLDLQMPLLSGSEVLAALPPLASRPKIVLLTGSISPIETFEGVDAMLHKPVFLEGLFRTVREVLDR